MSGLEVRAEQCETCIFRPGNPARLRPGRVAGMVRECAREQSFITCHETMTYTDDECEHATGPVCRGFYDAHGHVSQLVRIAERLGVLRFVLLAALVLFVAACSSAGDTSTPTTAVSDSRISTVTTADIDRPTATSALDVRVVGLRNRDGYCSTMGELTARKALESDWWRRDRSCVPGVPPTAGAGR